MRQGTKNINSIEKALEILLTFTPYNKEMRTVEISQNLGLHKATASRILNNLTRYGFLQQNAQTKKFRLGKSAIQLGLAVTQSVNNSNIVPVAKPFIDDLRDRVKETIVLEVVSEGEVLMAYIAEGLGPIHIKGHIGDRRPLHASAGAKAILAFSPSAFIDGFLNARPARFTPNTITAPEMLKDQLQEIRAQGFAHDNEEVNPGINAFGAPVFNLEETPVAAVAVAGSSQLVKWGDHFALVSQIKETAAKISERLYYGIVIREPAGRRIEKDSKGQ